MIDPSERAQFAKDLADEVYWTQGVSDDVERLAHAVTALSEAVAQIAAATDTFTETARRRLRDVRGGG